MVAEVALAFVLLTGAGLLMRSFFRMQQVDSGFDSTNVLTAGLPIPDKRFRNPEQPRRLQDVNQRISSAFRVCASSSPVS